jgi:hypothetical protein
MHTDWYITEYNWKSWFLLANCELVASFRINFIDFIFCFYFFSFFGFTGIFKQKNIFFFLFLFRQYSRALIESPSTFLRL